MENSCAGAAAVTWPWVWAGMEGAAAEVEGQISRRHCLFPDWGSTSRSPAQAKGEKSHGMAPPCVDVQSRAHWCSGSLEWGLETAKGGGLQGRDGGPVTGPAWVECEDPGGGGWWLRICLVGSQR